MPYPYLLPRKIEHLPKRLMALVSHHASGKK